MVRCNAQQILDWAVGAGAGWGGGGARSALRRVQHVWRGDLRSVSLGCVWRCAGEMTCRAKKRRN
eukprot:4004287-Prymnesium_polylepis.1